MIIYSKGVGVTRELELLLERLPPDVGVVVIDDFDLEERERFQVKPGTRYVIVLGHAPEHDYRYDVVVGDSAVPCSFVRRTQTPERIFDACEEILKERL